jgi:hypothetical protein
MSIRNSMQGSDSVAPSPSRPACGQEGMKSRLREVAVGGECFGKGMVAHHLK